jgi:hypothetical protein
MPADPVAMPGHESGGSVGRAHGLADVVGEIPVKPASNPAKFCSSPRRAGAKNGIYSNFPLYFNNMTICVQGTERLALGLEIHILPASNPLCHV